MNLPLKWYIIPTKGQLKVLEVFERDMFKKHTFTEIKGTLKEKSSNLIQKALKDLVNQNLLLKSKRGNSVFYSLNHENPLSDYYLGLIQQAKINRYPKNIKEEIQAIVSGLTKKNPYCCIILFGSYASMLQERQSDLDIAIITENKEQYKDYEIVLKSLSLKLLVKIDYQLMTAKEFLQMLLAGYENIAKQIYESNIPLYNNFVYYSILTEAKRHGFPG